MSTLNKQFHNGTVQYQASFCFPIFNHYIYIKIAMGLLHGDGTRICSLTHPSVNTPPASGILQVDLST